MQKNQELELPKNSKVINEAETEQLKGGANNPIKEIQDWLKEFFPKKDKNN